MDPIDLFKYFAPWKYFEDHIVTATNWSLGEAGKAKKLTLFKLKIWLGIWLVMRLHP